MTAITPKDNDATSSTSASVSQPEFLKSIHGMLMTVDLRITDEQQSQKNLNPKHLYTLLWRPKANAHWKQLKVTVVHIANLFVDDEEIKAHVFRKILEFLLVSSDKSDSAPDTIQGFKFVLESKFNIDIPIQEKNIVLDVVITNPTVESDVKINTGKYDLISVPEATVLFTEPLRNEPPMQAFAKLLVKKYKLPADVNALANGIANLNVKDSKEVNLGKGEPVDPKSEAHGPKPVTVTVEQPKTGPVTVEQPKPVGVTVEQPKNVPVTVEPKQKPVQPKQSNQPVESESTTQPKNGPKQSNRSPSDHKSLKPSDQPAKINAIVVEDTASRLRERERKWAVDREEERVEKEEQKKAQKEKDDLERKEQEIRALEAQNERERQKLQREEREEKKRKQKEKELQILLDKKRKREKELAEEEEKRKKKQAEEDEKNRKRLEEEAAKRKRIQEEEEAANKIKQQKIEQEANEAKAAKEKRKKEKKEKLAAEKLALKNNKQADDKQEVVVNISLQVSQSLYSDL